MGANNKKIWWKFFVMVIVAAIVFLIGFLVYKLFFEKESEDTASVSRYLMCTGKSVDDYVLFDEDNKYNDVNYEVRTMFIDDVIYNMNFIVSQSFFDEESTRRFTDDLLAYYNGYSGKNDVIKRDITTTFTNVDNIGKMVLAVKGKALNNRNAPLFMLDDYNENLNVGDMKNQYETKGFSCSISEEDMVLSD